MCACRRRSMEGYVSLGSSPTGLVRRTSRAFVVGVAVRTPRTTLDEARRCHGGSPTRGGAVPDLPLIEAAKLWAKVSARTGAAYLTGRWGGCRVLVFENLERASEAEPSHSLFLGEAGEWPHPEQATTPVGGRGVDTGSPRATGRSCRCDRGRGGGEARPAAPEGARGHGIQAASEGAEAVRGLERFGLPPAEGRRCRTRGGQGGAVHRGPARRPRAGIRRRDRHD